MFKVREGTSIGWINKQQGISETCFRACLRVLWRDLTKETHSEHGNTISRTWWENQMGTNILLSLLPDGGCSSSYAVPIIRYWTQSESAILSKQETFSFSHLPPIFLQQRESNSCSLRSSQPGWKPKGWLATQVCPLRGLSICFCICLLNDGDSKEQTR